MGITPSKRNYIFIMISGAKDGDFIKFAYAGQEWGSTDMEEVIILALQARHIYKDSIRRYRVSIFEPIPKLRNRKMAFRRCPFFMATLCTTLSYACPGNDAISWLTVCMSHFCLSCCPQFSSFSSSVRRNTMASTCQNLYMWRTPSWCNSFIYTKIPNCVELFPLSSTSYSRTTATISPTLKIYTSKQTS